jgi:hypothetical protein
MISLIGFAVVWIIGCLIFGFLVNTFRARQGVVLLNDGITAFIQGFTFGPIGIMAAFSAQQAVQGKTFAMATGGLVGTISFLYWYGMIWAIKIVDFRVLMLANYSTFKASQIILFEVLAAVEEMVKKPFVFEVYDELKSYVVLPREWGLRQWTETPN